MNEAREKARIGMANGEEKYPPMKDKGRSVVAIRHHADALERGRSGYSPRCSW
jgi:hypothetical protein